MDNSVVLDNRTDQTQNQNDLTSTSLPSDPTQTEIEFAVSPEEHREEIREQSMLELQRNANLNGIYDSQIYRDAREDLIELALSSSGSELTPEVRNRASEILIELGRHFPEFSRNEQFELYQDFESAHTEARREALFENIEALAQRHVRDSADASVVRTELQSLLESYTDVVSKYDNITTEVNSKYRETVTTEVQAQVQRQEQEQARVQVQAERDLMAHVMRSARSQANRYFDIDPSRAVPESVVNHQIETLLERYSDAIPTDPAAKQELVRNVLERYHNTYNRVYDRRFNQMSWVKRRWYGAKAFLRNPFKSLRRLANNIASTVTNIGNSLQRAGEALVEAGRVIADTVNDVLEKTSEALDELSEALVELKDTVVEAVEDTAVFLRDTAVSAFNSTVEAIRNGVVAVVTFDYRKLPGMIMRGIGAAKEAFDTVVEMAGDALETLNEWRIAAGEWIGETAYSAWQACTWENIKGVFNTINEWRIAAGEWIGETAYSAWQACTWENIKNLGNTINEWRIAAGEWIGETAYSAWQACTWENIKNLGNTINEWRIAAGEWLGETAYNIGAAVLNPSNWVKAATFAINSLKNGVEFVTFAIQNPVAAFNQIREGVNQVLEFISPVTDFLYDLGETLGINDIVRGAVAIVKLPLQFAYDGMKTAYNFGSNLAKVMSGEMTAEEFGQAFKADLNAMGNNALQNIKDVGLLVKGATRLLFECSGVADIFYMCKHLIRGEYALAAMHFAFAVGTIASVAGAVFTGGGSLAGLASIQGAKAAMRTAAKKLVGEATVGLAKSFGKELGEAALTKVTTRLGARVLGREASTEMLEKAGKEVLEQQSRRAAIETADTAIVRLNRELQENGIERVNAETVEELVEGVSREHGERLYRELGIEAAAEETAEEFLETAASMSIRDMRRALVEQGMSKSQARRFAKKFHKMLHNGTHDDVLKDILVREIEKPFREMIEKDAKVFSERFRKLLLNDADELATASREVREAAEQLNRELRERYGKEFDKFVDELTEAAERGFKKGRRTALREAVERGVKRALRKFRARRRPRIRPRSQKKENEQYTSSYEEINLNDNKIKLTESRESTRENPMEHDPSEIRFRQVVIDGKMYRQKFERATAASGNDQWTMTGVELIGVVEDQRVSLAQSEARGTTLRSRNNSDTYGMGA